MRTEPKPTDQRVLILAPIGRDAALICTSLARVGLTCTTCEDMAALIREIEGGAGVLLVSDQALSPQAGQRLKESLQAQPAWSDLPLVVLTKKEKTQSMAELAFFQRLSDNLTLLERPVRIQTLLTVTRSALRARQRQYEVRDHLLERTLREEALRQATHQEQLLRSQAEQAQAELQLHRDHLEALVTKRTAALGRANNDLKKEVAERRRAEAEKTRLLETVTRQKEELRALTTRLADLQESERFRLARELHDQVGQNLTALSFNLSFVQAQCETDVPDKEMVKNRIADSLILIEEITDRVREVLADLRPPVLDDYGLGEALQWYAGQFTDRMGLPVTLTDGTEGSRLGFGIESTLFRIVQEALMNVAKHAGASRVTISLKAEGHVVRLEIIDDGIGFDPAQGTDRPEHPTLGLLIMAERAIALGGQCWVESEPGQGTRVTVEIPQPLPRANGVER